MAEGEKVSFVDRLGPALTSGLVVTFLAAVVFGAVALRDLVMVTDVQLQHALADIDGLRKDFELFRQPGGRFTKHDGERLQAQLDDHEKRLREQETRPPRLNPGLEKLAESVEEIKSRCLICGESIKHILTEQDRLCSRVAACAAQRPLLRSQ